MSKPREFWIWPKNENSFFGEILSNEDYESAINPHCLKLSFKVIEYSAYENINKENEELKKENEIMREALKEAQRRTAHMQSKYTDKIIVS